MKKFASAIGLMTLFACGGSGGDPTPLAEIAFEERNEMVNGDFDLVGGLTISDSLPLSGIADYNGSTTFSVTKNDQTIIALSDFSASIDFTSSQIEATASNFSTVQEQKFEGQFTMTGSITGSQGSGTVSGSFGEDREEVSSGSYSLVFLGENSLSGSFDGNIGQDGELFGLFAATGTTP